MTRSVNWQPPVISWSMRPSPKKSSVIGPSPGRMPQNVLSSTVLPDVPSTGAKVPPTPRTRRKPGEPGLEPPPRTTCVSLSPLVSQSASRMPASTVTPPWNTHGSSMTSVPVPVFFTGAPKVCPATWIV